MVGVTVKKPGHKGGATVGSVSPATGLTTMAFVMNVVLPVSPSALMPAAVVGVIMSEVNRNFHTIKSGDEKYELT